MVAMERVIDGGRETWALGFWGTWYLGTLGGDLGGARHRQAPDGDEWTSPLSLSTFGLVAGCHSVSHTCPSPVLQGS